MQMTRPARWVLAWLLGAGSWGPAVQEEWLEREVGEGVALRYRHFSDFKRMKESVTVVVIDSSMPNVRIRPVAAGKLERTSAIAEKAGALVAINGGYFGKSGETLGLIKIDGKILAHNPSSRPPRAVIAFDKKGRPAFRRVAGGEDWREVTHALGAGPMVVENGRVTADAVKEGFDASFATARHPRSAVGVTSRGQILFVTVDGRTSESDGMTLDELGNLLKELGCVEAMNLDGGGSTTMVVRGRGEGGVINFPCDDGRFDHLGERSVANALLVWAPAVVVLDNDEEGFRKVGEWKTRRAGSDHVGGDYLVSTASKEEASATWSAALPFSGSYEVFARWPAGVSGIEASFSYTVQGKEITVNPRTRGGTWFSLGTFEFERSGAVILAGGSDEVLVADAIRFVQRQ